MHERFRAEREVVGKARGRRDGGALPPSAHKPRTWRGGISYLWLAATEPRRSAGFYAAVFDWKVDADREDPSFQDGTGHVIGHFTADLPVAGEAGVVPYVFLERVDETLEKVVAEGGEVVRLPYAEGDLRVATFRDPAENVIGVWEQASVA
jgi:predicted enzyme related to lactoylglutathione lyase